MTNSSLEHVLQQPVEKAILKYLSDGKAFTLIEIANATKIFREDIQRHLDYLIGLNILSIERHRFTYYKIYNSNLLAQVNKNIVIKKMISNKALSPLQYCRSCHGHLAGRVGRQMLDKMLAKGFFVKEVDFENSCLLMTDAGKHFFDTLGINVKSLYSKRGRLTKACLDFSERQHHLGGSLGVALLDKMLEEKWMERVAENSRCLLPTTRGKAFLREQLDMIF